MRLEDFAKIIDADVEISRDEIYAEDISKHSGGGTLPENLEELNL